MNNKYLVKIKGEGKSIVEIFEEYESFIRDKGLEGLERLYEEVFNWVEEPYKLFRHYTVYYFMKLFESVNSRGNLTSNV